MTGGQRCNKLGNLGSNLFTFFSVSPEVRIFLFSGNRESSSGIRSYDLLQGRRANKVRESPS
jgi:hypothetical protein